MRILLAIALVACATPAPTRTLRYANAPPVTLVDDRRDVAKPPAPRTTSLGLYHFDGYLYTRVQDAMALHEPRRALGVNALDEVPDSTWFTNRIGVRELSEDELRRGPAGIGSPERHVPWTILSTKVGGVSVGFIVKDARGVKFLVKFDEHDAPESETAAAVIINRLLWACGYNVPEDHVVYLRREDLVLGPNAVIKDVFGHKRPLTRGELDARLANVVVDSDGRIRAFASRILDGTWLGGHPQRGVRRDDPNDRIPHELRRDLRGAYAIYAWVDQVDVKEDNTLDMWVADPRDPAVHYVKHYLIDFGKGLGVAAWVNQDRRSGHEYGVDPASLFGSLITIGLHERPWEMRAVPPPMRGLGMYSAIGFAPGDWKPSTPAYRPFLLADRIDNLWASKLIIRFTRDQLRAIVEAGRLTDRRTVDYLVDTLVARQRATAAYWFARTSPLDNFAVTETQVCFDDLALSHGFSTAGVTRYRIDARELRPAAARSCAPVELGDYTVVRIETTRPTGRTEVFVHIARDPATGAPRVVGIWRA
jgi:hypothetical protein